MLWALLISCATITNSIGTPADPSDSTPIEVTVPQGATPRSLGPLLAEAGAIKDADRFTMYVRLSSEGGCLKAGRHRVRRSMSAGEILQALCTAPLADDVPFTVLEGWRVREIDAALAAKGLALPGEYTRLAAQPKLFKAEFPLPSTSLEGYLFPETYAVDPSKFSTRAFIQRQIKTFEERFWKTETASGTKLGKRSLHQVVTMASMVVREEPEAAQRPMVAGILWKRLDHSWNLGVDATSRYTLPVWNDRKAFLKKLRDPSDPYNTRKRSGLPPTAIGNPDLSSLNAALRPTASEYWYYLHDHDKVLRPSRSVQEHEAKRRQYNVY